MTSRIEYVDRRHRQRVLFGGLVPAILGGAALGLGVPTGDTWSAVVGLTLVGFVTGSLVWVLGQ